MRLIGALQGIYAKQSAVPGVIYKRRNIGKSKNSLSVQKSFKDSRIQFGKIEKVNIERLTCEFSPFLGRRSGNLISDIFQSIPIYSDQARGNVMPMMINVKTGPVSIPPGKSQSQNSTDMELTHTLQRLRHAQALSTKPAMHTYRPQAKLSAPVNTEPDQIFLHPCVSSRTCETPSLSPSSSSYSSSPVSRNGSPRLKRVVFADCVGLPLTEVRVFVGEPPVDSPSHCPLVMKRAPGPMGVPSGRCPLHQSVAGSPQLGPDFPTFRVTRPQDRMPFQAHNDTLRRVNGNFQKVSPHGLPKPHMQANAHTLAVPHGLPKAHTQANAHMPTTMRTQTPAEHVHPATAHTQAHTQSKPHTQLLSHPLPKGPVHTHSPPHPNNQGTSQRPPNCGHSFMVSRQQSPSAWQRIRTPLPQPLDSPPRVRSLASQSWAWREGMAVH